MTTAKKLFLASFAMHGVWRAAPASSLRGPARTVSRGRSAGRRPLSGRAWARRPPSAAFVCGHDLRGRRRARTCARPASDASVDAPMTWCQLKELFQEPGAPRGREDAYIASDHQHLARFRRSRAAQAAYDRHKAYLENTWRSPYDYLLVQKFGAQFGFEKVLVQAAEALANGTAPRLEAGCAPPEGYLYAAHPAPEAVKKDVYLRLVPNEFPYAVEGAHWCLWKVGGTGRAGISRAELAWALRELRSLPLSENLADEQSSGSGAIVAEGGEEMTSMSYDAAGAHAPRLRTFSWVNPPHLQSLPDLRHAHILVSRAAPTPGAVAGGGGGDPGPRE